MEDNYFVMVIFFERNAKYSHTLRVKKNDVYRYIEEWSRFNNGLCEILDMRKIVNDIKTGKIRDRKYE